MKTEEDRTPRAIKLCASTAAPPRQSSSHRPCDSCGTSPSSRETAFFRFPENLAALTETVVPEILDRKCSGPEQILRLWCAGCYSGEDAYSVAISVCEALNRTSAICKVHIVATDISDECLKVAERGVYELGVLRSVPPNLIPTYFSHLDSQVMVKSRLRSLVSFTRMDLAAPVFLGHFDVIFCMGVMPQLAPPNRSALLGRLHMFLEPGGYLFLGDDENLPASEVTFLPQAHGSCTIYRRPMVAAARSGR